MHSDLQKPPIQWDRDGAYVEEWRRAGVMIPERHGSQCNPRIQVGERRSTVLLAIKQ